MRIIEFLLARIAEDGAAAEAAAKSDPSKQGHYMDEGPAGNKWTAADGMVSGQSGDLWDCEGSDTLCTTPEVADHVARHDPARVLAECAAKRAIVDEFVKLRDAPPESMDVEPEVAKISALKFACRALASVYADHPDYDPDWGLVLALSRINAASVDKRKLEP